MGSALPTTTVNVEKLFHALSDEHRLRVLDVLRDGEHCVCDVAEDLDIKQPLLSFHLRILREAGLVRSAKVGRWVHYSIAPEAGSRLVEFGRALDEAARKATVVHCC